MSLEITKNDQGYYVCGQVNTVKESKMLAIIGSRRMSKYGKSVLEDIIPRLIAQDYTIVSGMAPGVDFEAMYLALKWGGNTIGILGYGFSHLKDKTSLDYKNARELSKTAKKYNGKLQLVSPFDIKQKPTKQTFLARNKVIAMYSSKVLVVEAMQKSGTFSTVDAALELNKSVYAVPGSIFNKTSQGANLLIKQGAMIFNHWLEF